MNNIDNKVEIPKYLAEYIEELKRVGLHISAAFAWDDDNPMPDTVKRWLFNNSPEENEKRFAMAVKAWMDGYKVEEDKYQIKLNGLVTSDGFGQYLSKRKDGGDNHFASRINSNLKQTFTKSEIKEIKTIGVELIKI